MMATAATGGDVTVKGWTRTTSRWSSTAARWARTADVEAAQGEGGRAGALGSADGSTLPVPRLR